jgi:hypothetical protein
MQLFCARTTADPFYSSWGIAHRPSNAGDLLQSLYRRPPNTPRNFQASYDATALNGVQQMDLLLLPPDRGYKYALVVVDLATRLVGARPLKNKRADTVLKALKEIYGATDLKPPQRMEVDDGSEFKGAVRAYLDKHDTAVRVGLPGRHRFSRARRWKLKKAPDRPYCARQNQAVVSTLVYVRPRNTARDRTIHLEPDLKPVYPNAHHRAYDVSNATYLNCKCKRDCAAMKLALPEEEGKVSWRLRRPCHARGCIYNEVHLWTEEEELDELYEPAEARALPYDCRVYVNGDDVKIVCVYKCRRLWEPYVFLGTNSHDDLVEDMGYEHIGAAKIKYVNGRYRVNVDAVHHEPYPLANWGEATLLSQDLNEIDEPIVAELLQKRLLQASLGYTQEEAEAAEREDELEELLRVDMWKWLDEVTKEDFNERYAEAAAV